MSDISGLADAAQRYARVELGSELGREVRRLQRSLDDAGVDDVGADLIFRELDGQRFVQGDQRALGRGVRVLGACESGQGRHRAHQDDGAAPGLLQVRDAVLGHPEHALEIDGHNTVPLRAVRLED